MALARRHRKKYSASHHHTMNELNITPLLDLAFVLLVIFIITTTPSFNDLPLNLPDATPNPKPMPPKLNTVAVDKEGKYYFNDQHFPDVKDLYNAVVDARNADSNITMVVRGDLGIQYQKVVAILDILSRANVTKVGLATEPQGK